MKIVIYSTKAGKSPFSNWLKNLDGETRAIIRAKKYWIECKELFDD